VSEQGGRTRFSFYFMTKKRNFLKQGGAQPLFFYFDEQKKRNFQKQGA
jgi:hypothetical protein